VTFTLEYVVVLVVIVVSVLGNVYLSI